MSEVSQDMDMLLLTQPQIAKMTALTRTDGAIYCKAATHIPHVADWGLLNSWDFCSVSYHQLFLSAFQFLFSVSPC